MTAAPCPHCHGTGKAALGRLVVAVDVPGLRLVSEANEPGMSIAKAGRTAKQRKLVAAHLHAATRGRGTSLQSPLVVVVTRIGPRALDDDNLAGSIKHVRDGIADWLGRDDGDGSVRWLCEQARPAKGAARYGVRVAIHEGT